MQLIFPSCGKNVGLEVILPSNSGRMPAVVVLHGAGGRRDFPPQVEQLVARGYVMVAPHYFDSTGTSWGDPESVQRHGVTWGKTILDAVDFTRKLPGVDPDWVGIAGFSLGGYLAVAVAAHDLRINCVVEFSGGVPEKLLPSLNRLPPILILHGEDDGVVPIRHAMRVRQMCEERNFYFEMETYSGAGHIFPDGLMQTAIERAMVFFDQRLKAQANSQHGDQLPAL